MVKFCVVPEADWAIIRQYLDESGAVLVPEHVVEQLDAKQQKKLRELEEEGYVNYDFGGEPETVFDTILSPSCYAASTLLSDDEDE